jgi:hypothetical protein
MPIKETNLLEGPAAGAVARRGGVDAEAGARDTVGALDGNHSSMTEDGGRNGEEGDDKLVHDGDAMGCERNQLLEINV